MQIYLDCCTLNRLTDDQSQPRIRTEADAAEEILSLIAAGELTWLGSDALRFELSRNPDVNRADAMLTLLSFATLHQPVTPEVIERQQHLVSAGLSAFDALHLAVCQVSSTTCLLTVDDRFIRQAQRLQAQPFPTEVLNPVDFLARRRTWQPRSS